MCRLTALPPFTTKREALAILTDFEGSRNRDGTGSAYVDRKTGEFVITKYPKSFTEVVRDRDPFLDHMPYPGWTIVHLRAASHGEVAPENTHPFVAGDWCVCHNGVWRDHHIARVIMEKVLHIHFEGHTDSEVATHLLALIGPRDFTQEIDFGGVFLGLRKDGSLYVIKTSGDLEVFERPRKRAKVGDGEVVPTEYVLASTLHWHEYQGRREAPPGYYHFAADGELILKCPIRFVDPELEAIRLARQREKEVDAAVVADSDGRGVVDRDGASHDLPPDDPKPDTNVGVAIVARKPAVVARVRRREVVKVRPVVTHWMQRRVIDGDEAEMLARAYGVD